jgi:hypothetical protein
MRKRGRREQQITGNTPPPLPCCRRSKVFLKYTHQDELQLCLQRFQEAARTLQRVTRGFLGRQEVRTLLTIARTQQAETSAFLELMTLKGEGARTRTLHLVRHDHATKTAAERMAAEEAQRQEIGRASCRERVCIGV